DEAEAGAEDPPREDEEEEDPLQAGGAAPEGTQDGAHRGEDPEHRHRLGVETAVAHLGEDDREHADEDRGEDERGVPRVGERGVGGDEERPEEGEDPRDARQGDGDDRPRSQLDGRAGHEGIRAPSPTAVRAAVTVSSGAGARTLATCGAKAGEEVTTSTVGPSAMISPSAMMTTRSLTSATNSTSCVDSRTVRPRSTRARRARRSAALAV